MDKVAANVFPIVKVDEWREWCREVEHGERADAHREFLGRIGVTREHIFHQATPQGDMMIEVWEGVDPEEASAAMGNLLQNPQSDHERYLVDHVVRELHGVDPTTAPAPAIEKVATIET